MKKKMVVVGIVIVIISVVVVVLIGVEKKRCSMDFATSGKAVFRYCGSDVSMSISDEHLSAIKDIFNNKKMYMDNLSCGFSEDIAIVFNNSETFCIARDTCPTVYWKEQGRYIELSEDEKEELYGILGEYGFVFPCV